MTQPAYDPNYGQQDPNANYNGYTVAAYVPPVAAVANPYEQIGLITPNPDGMPRRLVLSVAGFEKTGKTHLALTGRTPVVVINLDVGTEGVAEKFKAAGKDIYIYNIPLERPTSLIDSSDGATQDVWRKQWINLNTILEKIYALNPGTVVIDTFTEVYELVRLAHFGKTSQVMPHQYGPVNAEMRNMVRQAYAADVTTTIFIHKMGIGFDSKLPEVKGWRDMEYSVQMNLRNERYPSEAGHGMDRYVCTVRDCRQNPHANGIQIYDENFSVPYLEWLVLDWRPQ